MAAESGNSQVPPERGVRPGSAVNTLLKIQSQFEEWEERDRSKRRRSLLMISAALLAAAGVIALATLLPEGNGPGKPAATEPVGAKAPPSAPAAQAVATRYVTALTPEPRLARYAENWRKKIEAQAAAQFLQGAHPGNLYGSLVLTTFIRPDGSVERIEISRSSGRQSLDEAAVDIVRAAAPFEPLPEEIRRDTGTLAIVRTFSFEPDNAGAAH